MFDISTLILTEIHLRIYSIISQNIREKVSDNLDIGNMRFTRPL